MDVVLWLVLQEGGANRVLRSVDRGYSWSLNGTLPAALPVPQGISPKGRPAVGHGIQLSPIMCGGGPCAQAGRLVLPFVCSMDPPPPKKPSDTGCPGCLACTLYSDDAGRSWQVGGPAQPGTRESMLVQTRSNNSQASLYANERYMASNPGLRRSARSFDGGATYSQFWVSNISEPVTAHWTGVVSGIERLTLKWDNSTVDRLVYSGVTSRTARVGLGLSVSEDEGRSWRAPRTLWSGPAGYSDMSRLDDGQIAVIFENGETTFADRVSVCIVPTTWILATDDKGYGSPTISIASQ
jgi:sialidase-1